VAARRAFYDALPGAFAIPAVKLDIIRSLDRIPPIDQSALELASDMLREKDIAALPRDSEPALLLVDPARRAEIVRAFERIRPMFWGDRIPLDETCTTIIDWVRGSLE
jgi:hypothetical protein